MLYRLTQFLGEIPRRDPTLLPKGAAQQATNVDFGDGGLRPMLAPTTAHTASGQVVDFIAHGGEWLTFGAQTSHAPGPVAQDRLYITTDGETPKLRDMQTATTYDLALPTPVAAPIISIQTEPDDPEGLLPVETVLFVTTWVTTLDEETPPSPISNALDVPEGATVAVSIVDHTPPTGTRINRIRVYRSQTSATGITTLYFVKELSVSTPTYVHDLDVDPLQEPLQSMDYDPPVATLKGITPLQQGMMAAFSGRSLYFCEPFIPHAWPIKYELKTDYDIVGLAATGNLLVILTTGTPYIASGTAPDNMILERIDTNLPCVSRAGIVDTGMGVIYPSHDGLVMMQGASAQVISKELFDRRAWRGMNPSTIKAGNYDGRYVFTYDGGPAVMVDTAGEVPGLARTTIAAQAFAYDLIDGALYFTGAYNSGADTTPIQEFAPIGAGPLDLVWHSGTMHLPVPQSFGVLQVDGAAVPGGTAPTITVYGDGQTMATTTSLNTFVRIKDGLSTKWEIKVEGAAKVTRISMAGDPDELFGAG